LGYGKDLAGLRDQNLSVLLSTIWENAPISRKDLATLTGLSPSSITRLIQQLQKHKLIIETGKGVSSGGRLPLLVTPNPDAGLIMCLDLSGSKLHGGIFDATNQLVLASDKPFENVGAEAIKRMILDFCHELYSSPQVLGRNFLGIGVSIPGRIDAGQVLAESFNLKLQDFPIHRILTNKFQLPVFLEVDTAAAALAEKYYGAGVGIDNFVYILVSIGIGGSAIIDGKLYQGKAGFVGYLGHIIVDPNGPICLCGKRGCLEKVAAGPAILDGIRNVVAYERGDPIITKMAANLEHLELEKIAEAARQGSALAVEGFENSAYHLAYAISIIATILDVSTFIIGGEVSQYGGDLYLNAIRRSLEKIFNLNNKYNDITILQAKLERDSLLKGIGMLSLLKVLGIQS
jgi:N-acetylglucosamine repressor